MRIAAIQLRKDRMSDILDSLLRGVLQEGEVIKIRLERRRGARQVTIVEGIDSRLYNHKELVSILKSRLACGGTYKEGRIELQGDQRYKVRDMLVEMGFPAPNMLVEE